MANFTPKKIDTSTINSGQEYAVGDMVAPSAINSPIESGLYTEIIADGLTQAPDISQIAGNGTPAVEFVDGTTVNGVKTKKFAFKNLVGGFITSDDTVKSVVDYGDTSKNIKIGYSGSGITGGNIKYIAGYTVGDGTTNNVARIKDISKDALKSWLGYATVATSGSYNDLSNTPTIPTVNNGTLTIKQNGTDIQTFSANQSGNVTANITVPTKASDVNALSLDGGTINKSKTVKMDASANSDGANLKWGTVNSKNPYIGYASDQVDGTFVVGSLLGTNYASGLAIGGGSGNLLWKGAKVATTSDIPDISGKVDKSAFSLSGTTLTITI